ncbi:MAG TPA: molybdopterin molybdenumtransferase MoeA, partial [Rhodobacteraceae bacterium]|nr:molybdopterin molybdenumtransferase MoeA [Paracoccaceae bacterium]
MRPGKPLMAGRMGDAAMLGLPGNPVSAMVCGRLFLVPMLEKMLGLGEAPEPLHQAPLGADLGPNGPRQHYMRARLEQGRITAAESQDSSLLTVLAAADALLVRPPHDPARKAGDMMDFLPL